MFVEIVGNTNDDTTKSLFLLFKVASIAVLLVFTLALFSLFIEENPSFGPFGDFVGGMLNPVLTFLMFMGLLITIILQQKELSLTRKEYVRTADALEEARLEAKKQTELLIEKSQKTDIYNSLNDTKKELDSLLFTEASQVIIKEVPAIKWWQFRIEYQRVCANKAISDDLRQKNDTLATAAYTVGLDLDRIVNNLDLFYHSLLELKRLNTKEYLVENYAAYFSDQISILKEIVAFNSDIDTVINELYER